MINQPTSRHGWRFLKNDKRAIFTAAPHAPRATDYLRVCPSVHTYHPRSHQAVIPRRPLDYAVFSISSICAPSGASMKATWRPLLTCSSMTCAPLLRSLAISLA